MSEYIINSEDYVLGMATIPYLREKIVRCRDCVHYKPYRTLHHGMMNRCHDEHGYTHKRDESDFCSRGERRTNDN